MTHASAVVDAYFAAVVAGDPEAVVDLFAPDAVLQNAAGTLNGREAIAAMYRAGVAPGAMKPSPRPYVVNGDTMAVEIDLSANGKAVALADFFTVREGKIQRLAIYSLTPADARFFDDKTGEQS
ncbi:uncharacterized protein (TIGR02246 family) [Streptomyces brevispora]|uniref:Uncharacterized protein (TIGR02246 family) n=1 Tax=Streptomyces brevispora TaxID=887462 RepID=A0A561V476_9ACTN|nr:nuclear transport factor 2 family protein [Streptomyces brevispora]TWG06418.1 uncharacterized protein (TIGR02246 family) [Streptomyces brevispora]